MASTGFRVQIKGAKALADAISDDNLLDRMLRPGFEQAAVEVKGAAKSTVHRVTGKLQGSIDTFIEGHGRSIEAHIGPQAGFGDPAHYTKAMTSRWEHPRDGWNTGDPRIGENGKPGYAVYEEARHKFLEPAMVDNLDRIENIIDEEANRVLDSLGRRR